MEDYKSLSLRDKIIVGIVMIIGLTPVWFLLWGVTVALLDIDPVIESEHLYNETIVSIKDNSQVEGNIRGGIFLIRGNINQKEYYMGYKQNEDGSFSQFKVPVERSKIYETTDGFRLEIYEFRQKNTGLFVMPCHQCTEEHRQYKIYVPKGSIVQDFTLDAE